MNDALSKRMLVVMVCRCSVDYEGRGATRLTEGERLIIIKQDGSFLVHRPTGYSPANWQPETSSIHVSLDDDVLLVKAVRLRPREVVVLRVSEVKALLAAHLVDQGEFIEWVDEHQIRSVLVDNPGLIEDGLKVVSIEKPVEPGFIDMYCVDRNGNLVVIEIKRVTAGKDAVFQLKRYVDAVRSYANRPVRGILVAPDVSKPALRALESMGLEYRRIDLSMIYKMLKSKEERARGGPTLLSFLEARGPKEVRGNG